MDQNQSLVRVAHSVRTWLPLTEIWIFNQLNNMKNIESIVLAQELVNQDAFQWPHLYPMNQYQQFMVKGASRLGFKWKPNMYHRAVRLHKVDILHSHFGNIGWSDMELAKKNNLKHIVSVYGADVNRVPVQRPEWRQRYKDLFAQADMFLCEGPFMGQNLINLGCPEDKIRIQRLGVDVGEIKYSPRKFDGIGALKILIAGTFREKKGIPYAMKAIGRLIKDGVNIEVTVIGDSNGHAFEEEEKRKILETIEQYDMQSRVSLLGYQPYATLLAEAYKNHLFISPSVRAEDGDAEGGAPVVLMDLMATGMPIISTTHCDIPQIVIHEQNGLLASERNVDELVNHLIWFLEHPTEWQRFSEHGRHHVETFFDASQQALTQEKIYQELA